MAYKVPPLRFAYDALEPYIDAETIELHHDRHHQAASGYLLAWWNVVAWDVVDERLNFRLEVSQRQSPSSVVREEK
jgi:superoxide dismutase